MEADPAGADPAGAGRRAWSITTRLAAGYAALTTLILVAALGFLYWALQSNLHRSEERFLSDKIQVLQTVAQGRVVSDRLREEVQLEIAAYQFTRYFARVLDAADGRGDVLIQTDGMAALLPPRVFPAPTSTAPEQSQPWTAPSGRRYLLMAARTPPGQTPPGQTPPGEALPGATTAPRGGRVLQVALDVTSQAELLADYRRALLVVLLVAALCSAAGGVVVARRGMRPLATIAQAAERISATQLGERIRPSGWPAELTALARAFDAMLGRLEASFERLSRFSADLAHELRTPVSNLMGEAEVTLSKPRTKAEYRRVLESSLEEYGRLARMITNLLFLARAEGTSDVPLAHEAVDARAQIDTLRAVFDAVAAEQGVALRCEGQATLHADPALLRRAVSNLVANALEHTPPGGSVTLSAQPQPGGAAAVAVEDTGCGIAPEHLPHLFDRFYQADPARAGRAEDAGLGLSIVQSIMDLHGGTTHVDSTPGRGTTVTLRLPGPASGGKVSDE